MRSGLVSTRGAVTDARRTARMRDEVTRLSLSQAQTVGRAGRVRQVSRAGYEQSHKCVRAVSNDLVAGCRLPVAGCERLSSRIAGCRLPMDNTLVARGLVKRFSSVAVVHGVDLVVKPGEVTGYLGPNGSGKTVTVQMLTGLLPPSAGSIQYGGRDIFDDLIAFRRRLGYLPEEPHLYRYMSGRSYLQLVGRLRGLPESLLRQKIDALLEAFGIDRGRRTADVGLLERDEAEGADQRRARARPRRADSRRARIGPRRVGRARASPSDSHAGRAGQGDSLQLAHARQRREGLRARYGDSSRPRRRRRLGDAACAS